jgi:asparagine synthase (glutamine-hydrolysing)
MGGGASTIGVYVSYAPDSHARYDVIRSGRSAGVGGNKYYGYGNDDALYEHLASASRRSDFPSGTQACSSARSSSRIPSRFEPEQRLALAHVHCDWHDPVSTALARVSPHLSVGGKFVIDDYYDHEGCRTAGDESFAAHSEYRITTRRPSLVI